MFVQRQKAVNISSTLQTEAQFISYESQKFFRNVRLIFIQNSLVYHVV